MIRGKHKSLTVLHPSMMTTDRNDVMKKGKALILALSEKEKQAIYNRLDAYERQLFTTMSNWAWSNL